jgi:hypothetical protein
LQERLAAAEARLHPPRPVEIRVEWYLDRADSKLLLVLTSRVGDNERDGLPVLDRFTDSEIAELDRLLEALPREQNAKLRFETDVVEELATEIERETGCRSEIAPELRELHDDEQEMPDG